MHPTSRLLTLAGTFTLIACSGNTSITQNNVVGQPSTGGAGTTNTSVGGKAATGGNASSGGSKAVGGTNNSAGTSGVLPTTGGETSTAVGGTTGAGGVSGVGGSAPSGGTSSAITGVGGTTTTGGTSSTKATTVTGGVGVGGAATGGAASGGTKTGVGGAATGGAATGGATTSGATGGTATGGATTAAATGGAATGGAATGGAATGGAATGGAATGGAATGGAATGGAATGGAATGGAATGGAATGGAATGGAPYDANCGKLAADSHTVALYHFDEGTGQVVNDSSGNSRTAYFGNSSATETVDPTWSKGRFGGHGVSFSRASQQLVHATQSNTFPSNQLTLETWIRPVAPYDYSQFLTVGFINGYMNIGWTGNLEGAVGDGNNWSSCTSTGNNLNTVTWHYVAMTYSGSAITLWLDGVALSTCAASATLASPNYYNIGGRNQNTYINGEMDELRISDIARSTVEIASYYATANVCTPAP